MPKLMECSGNDGIWAHRIARFIFGGWAKVLHRFEEDPQTFFQAKFQGTYKLHKDPGIDLKRSTNLTHIDSSSIPIRPVINSIGDWRKNGAFWIGQILQPIVSMLHGITTSSRQTIRRYETVMVPDYAWLVEFDIKDFFLNIPMTYCTNVITWALDAHAAHLPRLHRQLAISILRHLLCHNYFNFDGKSYKQIKGIAMGCDCASQVAAIVAWHFENYIGAARHPLVLGRSWQRYLDDGLFGWVGTLLQLESFKELLNTAVATPMGTCQFVYTFEVKSSSAVFMDMHWYKGSRWASTGILDVKLYDKPANPHAYIPYNSGHPPSLARSWVRLEIIRRATHNSEEAGFLTDAASFMSDLISRGYSGTFVRSIFASVQYSDRYKYLGLVPAVGAPIPQEERALTLVTPWHPEVTARIREHLDIPSSVAQHLTCTKIRMAFTIGPKVLACQRGR